ncbi:hypothetical protein ACIP98_42285 [Streptomyces sp. NPDC088354]|uniref:hypothetical protein n=1 Tax=Streptomyces sp. NPDC088354 TaxID=3365856 RepID=UPI0037F38DB8
MRGSLPAGLGKEAEALAALGLGAVARQFPLAEGAVPLFSDDVELIVNNTWRPVLSVRCRRPRRTPRPRAQVSGPRDASPASSGPSG